MLWCFLGCDMLPFSFCRIIHIGLVSLTPYHYYIFCRPTLTQIHWNEKLFVLKPSFQSLHYKNHLLKVKCENGYSINTKLSGIVLMSWKLLNTNLNKNLLNLSRKSIKTVTNLLTGHLPTVDTITEERVCMFCLPFHKRNCAYNAYY